MTDDVDPIVTINDIRKAGYCALGARSWFEAYNLDFRTFLKHPEAGGGLPASVLLATGDACAARVVELKKARENG